MKKVFLKVFPYVVVGVNIGAGVSSFIQGKAHEGILSFIIAGLFACLYYVSNRLEEVRTHWGDCIRNNRELLDLNIELLDKMVVMNKDLEEYSKPKEAETW